MPSSSVCRSCQFQATEHWDQVVSVNSKWECHLMDSQKRTNMEVEDLIADCEQRTTDRESNSSHPHAMEELTNCMLDSITQTLMQRNEELAFETATRQTVANLGENYTCADQTLETSPALYESHWQDESSGQDYAIQVLHERPASQIHVLENFVSPEECQAMEDSINETLAPAMVFDGNGGATLNEHRKAVQAAIHVPTSGLVTDLNRRIYAYTNQLLPGLNLTLAGQEPYNAIQYYGRGLNDTAPDRYRQHCDSFCDGKPHKEGSRVATMVMYCQVPEIGGHTNFAQVGVHVKPRRGDAVFFSYIDPETRISDTGLTTHSGCPVYEGTKKIVTHWMRLGVDSENPFYSFNTLGQKIPPESKREEEHLSSSTSNLEETTAGTTEPKNYSICVDSDEELQTIDPVIAQGHVVTTTSV